MSDRSDGTDYLLDRPELWESTEDLASAKRDLRLYGNVYVIKVRGGLLRRIDPSLVEAQWEWIREPQPEEST